MSQYKYSATVNEHRARAVGLLLPISAKQGIEICNFIRGKDIQKARDTLNEVIDMKKPIPFTRFTEGAGHKHGIGPGKYPVKACREILKLVNLVEANAQHNGLDTSSLVIIHACAKKGPKSWHYGRQSRIAMKRTHIEIVVEEKEIKKKEVKKETKKVETKKELVKEEESKPIKKQEEKKKEKPKEIKEIEKTESKKEQPKDTKKPVEEKKEALKKETKTENIPTAAELAEKAKSKQEPKKIPTINELTKKKENKKTKEKKTDKK